MSIKLDEIFQESALYNFTKDGAFFDTVIYPNFEMMGEGVGLCNYYLRVKKPSEENITYNTFFCQDMRGGEDISFPNIVKQRRELAKELSQCLHVKRNHKLMTLLIEWDFDNVSEEIDIQFDHSIEYFAIKEMLEQALTDCKNVRLLFLVSHIAQLTEDGYIRPPHFHGGFDVNMLRDLGIDELNKAIDRLREVGLSVYISQK